MKIFTFTLATLGSLMIVGAIGAHLEMPAFNRNTNLVKIEKAEKVISQEEAEKAEVQARRGGEGGRSGAAESEGTKARPGAKRGPKARDTAAQTARGDGDRAQRGSPLPRR